MTIVKIKRQKVTKICHKRKLKFENYKSFLKAIQLGNEINYLVENKMT